MPALATKFTSELIRNASEFDVLKYLDTSIKSVNLYELASRVFSNLSRNLFNEFLNLSIFLLSRHASNRKLSLLNNFLYINLKSFIIYDQLSS